MTPNEVKFHKRSNTLELVYDNTSFDLSAEFLRVHSPSAEVQGHSPGQEVLQHGKKDVQIRSIDAQGNYAIRIVFSDGHDSGIYSWQYLYELGDNQDKLWADYLARLEKAGKSRESLFIAKG